MTNENHLRMLTKEMTHFGQIGVDKGYLKLKMPANQQTIGPIHKLEKRLGVLLTQQEIAAIRRNIRGDDQSGGGSWNTAQDIEVLGMDDRDFFNEMMRVIECGTKFVKHKKGGVYDERFVLIHNDRLYWKDQQNGENKKFGDCLMAHFLSGETHKNILQIYNQSQVAEVLRSENVIRNIVSTHFLIGC